MKRKTVFVQELLGRAPRQNSVGQKSAFTIIELIIVIAIMSMLAGLLLPALGKARQRARVAKCSTTIGSLQTALAMYSLDYGVYPPSAQDGGLASDQYNGNCSLSALDGSPNNLVNALQATAESGPYMEFKGKDLDETESGPPARPVLLDPWGQAYIYVCQKDIDVANVNSARGPFHPNATGADKNTNTYNIYSLGPDRETYGGEGHDDTADWNDTELFDNEEDGHWNSPTDSDDPRYDDVNSWDGARGG